MRKPPALWKISLCSATQKPHLFACLHKTSLQLLCVRSANHKSASAAVNNYFAELQPEQKFTAPREVFFLAHSLPARECLPSASARSCKGARIHPFN
jgi:hypothetical protein